MSASRRLIVNADDPGRTSGVHRGLVERIGRLPPQALDEVEDGVRLVLEL